MFQLNYRKNKNVELFKDIQEKMGVSKVQNYMPLYQHYFSLNNTNYNGMNLNTFKSLNHIESKIDENTYKTDVGVVHVKYAPLYDTYKYMVGKLQDVSVNVLPSLDGTPASIICNNFTCFSAFSTTFIVAAFNKVNSFNKA